MGDLPDAAEWLRGAIGEQRQLDPAGDVETLDFATGVLDRLAERGFALAPTAQVFGTDLETAGVPECAHPGCTAFADGESLHRLNPKGEDFAGACDEHYGEEQRKREEPNP